ncbi:hypothetical protein AMATHDRAFT_11179 [Amanita thiersii Skay4041]|uniref:Uncharacterized protein n=1 Tax=Amanita thiersii Skay4041 TaxID=703135 RepID=A0A2A9N7G1_9AGAR|nr:hypothetical protein AMATHDRAFT_11179 [Amanita thiersii Skay4041]
MSKPTQDKVDLVKKQGWETAKKTILQNPSKFLPSSMDSKKHKEIVSKVIDDLRNKEDDSWSLKIIKDIKNKGLQSQALENRIHSVVRRLDTLANSAPPRPCRWTPSRGRNQKITNKIESCGSTQHRKSLKNWLHTFFRMRENAKKNSIGPPPTYAPIRTKI